MNPHPRHESQHAPTRTAGQGEDDGRILLLAPHSDDIAYSLGATMLSPWWWRRPDLTVLTLFTRSRHAPYLQTGSEEEITRTRMAEDGRYAGRLGARWIAGPFGEAQTRGYPDTRSLYVVRSPEDDRAFADVEGFLRPLLAGPQYRFVLAPLGIGGHIEHDIVFRIVSQSAGIPALFYEDQPYAADYSDFYLERLLDRRLGSGRVGLVCASTLLLGHKIDQLHVYASQFQEADAEPLRYYASHRNPGRSRVQHLAPSTAGSHLVEILWGSKEAVEQLVAELRSPRYWRNPPEEPAR